jgi:hypothetical protein
MEDEMKGIYIGSVILAIGFILLGWFGNNLYKYYNYERTYNGLRIGNSNYSTATEISRSYDRNGNWVCVNVRDMDYKQAQETCDHEAGHEIFAVECGKNITRCMEVVGK